MPTQRISRGKDRHDLRIVWDEYDAENIREQPLVVTPYNNGVDVDNHEQSVYMTFAQAKLLAKVLNEIVKEAT